MGNRSMGQEFDENGRKLVPLVRSKLFRVGVEVGKLRITSIDYGSPSRYWVTCACGKEERLTYHQLFYGKGCCADCRVRKVSSRVDQKWKGEQTGRLMVGEWVPTKGWECMCIVCDKIEYVRWTSRQ